MQVALYLAGEITQVLDAIPWVRCASGNVFLLLCHTRKTSYLMSVLVLWCFQLSEQSEQRDLLPRWHCVE